MGIFTGLFERRGAEAMAERSSVWDFLDLGTSAAGIGVTPDSAMTSSAVYACVRILSETVASLPLVMYRRQDRGKTRAPEHPLYRLLHDQPNDFMTALELRETLQAHLALWGNAYAQLDYNGAGQVTGIFPLRPDKMQRIETQGGQRVYHYQTPSGQVIPLNGARIWHLRGLGSDGLFGYSPIQLMRNSVGLSMATEKYGAKFFGNGARPGGVLEHPGKLSDASANRLRSSWNEMHMGLDNSHKVAILEEGLKWHEVGLPPEDSQFLETRRFQVQEIARIYRVPPHMLADLERATFSNIEHQGIEFVVHTIRPWLVRWEQSISSNLMTERDRQTFYPEHLVDGLLRGDTASRYQAYATGRQNGWLSANDIRALENMNPVDGGDVYLVPLNMIPAEDVGSGQRQITAESSDGSRQLPADSYQLRAKGFERRGRDVAAGRLKLAGRQARVFKDAGARLMRRERNDVTAQAKKMIGTGPRGEFERWLDQFYLGHREWMAEQVLPVMQAYAEMVSDLVSVELGRDDDVSSSLERFTRAYAKDFGNRQANRSLTRLLELVRRQGLSDDELLGEIDARLDEWVETRPAAMANEESVRQNNAVAVMLYAAMSVERLMSVATGESDCPYCTALDGKIVGINEFILQAGQDFNPEGAATPLRVTNSMQHAPYHSGCDCVTVAA